MKTITETVLQNKPELKARSIQVRAEDVPYWIEQYMEQLVPCIGITGEDLFLNYKLGNPDTTLGVLEMIEWNDQEALFGKPALCLLARNMPSCGILKLGFDRKYEAIVNNYIGNLCGYDIELLPFNGSLERACELDIVDAVVDIVYTGKSIQDFNLQIIDVIVLSNLVIIGDGRND